MPNYKEHRVSFDGPNDIIQQMLEAVSGEDRALDFNKIIPQPELVVQGDITFDFENNNPGRNWYQWRCRNWGTKWNCLETKRVGDTLFFETAWYVPIPLLKEWSALFPEITFIVEAVEDINVLADEYIFQGGKTISERYIHPSRYEELKKSIRAREVKA